MFSRAWQHFPRLLGRPSDFGCLAHSCVQFSGEILVGLRAAHARKWREGGGRCLRQRRVSLAIDLIVETPANHGPITQIVSNGPHQFDDAVSEFGNLASGSGEEVVGSFTCFAWKHEQELTAAARTEQDTGQSEFGQKGTRKNFAEQRNPLRTAGEQIFARRTRRLPLGGRGQQELFCPQDFTLQQDLFGHRRSKALRTPNFSTDS